MTEELQLHLERETERLRASGLSADAARLQAVRTFGGVEQIKEECRDARGTAFVDDTRQGHPICIANVQARSSRRLDHRVHGGGRSRPGHRGIHDAQRAPVSHRCGAGRPRDVRRGADANVGGEHQGFTRAQLDALRRETNVFTSAYAQLSDVNSRIDGRLMFGTFVTGNFFQVVRVNAAMGRTLMPADDEPFAGQPVMVLSHRGWDRLFARDPAILGHRLLVNGVTFEIVGVMPEGFRGLAIAPDDYWAPLSVLGHVRPSYRGREATVGLDIIGRLKPGMSWQTAQAGLAVWDSAQSNGQCDHAQRFEHHPRSEARYRAAASRGGGRGRALVLCVRPHSADWLCQRRQPPPRQSRRTTA